MASIQSDDAGDSEDLQALFDEIAVGGSKPAAPPPAAVRPLAPAQSSTGDSDDLQALFDTVASGSAKPVPPPPPVTVTVSATAPVDTSGDSDDLQALFDNVIASTVTAAVSPAPTSAGEPGDDAVFNRLGHMARQLHESLRGLGFDNLLSESAKQIPDARQRLNYIAQMTEQAASRVLNATDIAMPIQDDLIARSKSMAGRWESMFANQLSVDEFKQLASDTRAHFVEAPGKLGATNAQLMEIIMAQDFQDLTGQVIKKIVDLVNGLEQQVLSVLIESMPEAKRPQTPDGMMNGPTMNPGASDVVATQDQVDDLLESLGF